jgi:L-lactate dehydrogenase
VDIDRHTVTRLAEMAMEALGDGHLDEVRGGALHGSMQGEAAIMNQDRIKVGMIGAGRVGATTAFATLMEGIADSIVLLDSDTERAEGEAMDLMHVLPFVGNVDVCAGGYDALENADVVVVTAGSARSVSGDRLDLARRNIDMLRDVLPQVLEHAGDAILVIVSNPVDLLTLAAVRSTGLPPGKVIGTGTMLDTARLRSLLGHHFGVDPHNVHAYVLGEHGESEVISWSLSRIASIDLPQYAGISGREWDDGVRAGIEKAVRHAGAEVIRRKGATNFAIGMATARLLRAIVRNERSIQTVSTTSEDGDVSLSLPCVIGRTGRIATVPIMLDEGEQAALESSADRLREAYLKSGGPS